jgi:phosphate transport system permease protein
MTDAPASSAIREAVSQRLAKRHRAEKRFRAYGVGAIALAVIFLAILLGSIGFQSLGAFTMNTLTLPVTISERLADPRGDGTEESLRRGNYNAIIQDGLRAQFPSVDDRAELRDLFGLYNGVNSASLMRKVVANPSLVGGTTNFTLPLSDDVDLYLKGITVSERFARRQGALDVVVSDRTVRLESAEPAFADFLTVMRDELVRRADEAAANASRLDSAAGSAATRDEREALLSQSRRQAALSASLRERAEAEGDVTLGTDTPALFLQAEGGVIQARSVSRDGRVAVGEILLPLQAGGPITDWTEWAVETPSSARRISDRRMVYARTLEDRGMVRSGFNTILFTNADSRAPELAGVLGAMIGSILTMLVTMVLAVPIGVGTAIYLEEFAPKNRLTNFIEVNINNLAAVPSIVFGLLGLAIFINLFGLPRSAPLVGGMVLALMTLPTVIISSRAALRAVPPSIREAALGVGASRTQAVFHHVLPLAMPGILTGSIIGLAQALGETAPLLMIGMVAFIADPPTLGLSGFLEPSTVMPVQIYLWSGAAERAFEMRTAAAIITLLSLMIMFNAAAIYLRRRFERRW